MSLFLDKTTTIFVASEKYLEIRQIHMVNTESLTALYSIPLFFPTHPYFKAATVITETPSLVLKSFSNYIFGNF